MSDVHPCPVIVLRLGHRVPRDKRVTTHVCLVARAFGAQGVFIAGDYDPSVIETVTKLTEKWGGPFWVEFTASPEKLVDSYKQKG
ncbi:MAG TPA: tRNA (cytidine(56)-2'-O)-methyltransferase, partial [Candidatus Methanomethylia archaeon]|nr:tRNA (cytidine(56)-2'-O)-methyltransferase [Candidatus Methanomethylicia archaeon]